MSAITPEVRDRVGAISRRAQAAYIVRKPTTSIPASSPDFYQALDHLQKQADFKWLLNTLVALTREAGL